MTRTFIIVRKGTLKHELLKLLLPRFNIVLMVGFLYLPLYSPLPSHSP
jgi:hypothetical protein